MSPSIYSRGQSCTEFFNAHELVLARETSVALDEKYRPRYNKKKKTFKLYDGRLGTIVFPHLKGEGTNLTNRVRKELKKTIKDKKLTKGFYDPKYLFDTLEGFYSEDKFKMNNNPSFLKAKEIVAKQIVPKEHLKPIQVHKGMDLRDALSTLNTSAGFKFYGKKKKFVKSYMVREALRIKEDVKSGKSLMKIEVQPYIAITRSQLPAMSTKLKYVRPVDESGNVKYKGRLVWCEDAAMVLFEAQYARPLIDYCAQNWANIAMGKSPEQIRSVMCEISEDFGYWYSTDFSKYDSSVPAGLIRHAFDIVKLCFEERYHRELDLICTKFIHADILMPDMNIYHVDKGIKSGSYFTQIIGSIVNALMLETFLQHKFNVYDKKTDCLNLRDDIDVCLNLSNGKRAYMFMGDDNIFGCRVSINYAAFARFVHNNFGMNINIEKSDKGIKGIPVSFLKRDWTRNGEYRDEVDLLGNMLHPERKRTYKNYSPYHILFGYFMTYRGSMERLGFSLKQILKGMRESEFGIEAFYNMNREELPGSVAALKYSNIDAFEELVESLIEEAERDYEGIWSDRSIA